MALARRNDPQTSHAAAEATTSFAGTHAQKCLAVITHYGKAGQSLIAEQTGLLPHAVNKRLNDLQRKGEIIPTKETVESHSGRQERVWILTPPLPAQETLAL